MPSKTSFSGHGKLGTQHSFKLPPLLCGIINSDSSRDGFLKVRSFFVKVKYLETPITHPSQQIQEKPSDTAPKFWPRPKFLMEIILPQRPEAWVSFNYSSRLHDVWQILIINFFSRAQAPLPPRKAHHTPSLRRQFLRLSQELKFLCYRRIRRQVH